MSSDSTSFAFRERYEPEGKPRWYARSYDVLENDRLRWQCHVTQDLWPAVEFVAPVSSTPDFALVPTRRIAALSYDVLFGPDRQRIARASRRLGVRWVVKDATDREVGRLANPTSWPKSILEQAFDVSTMRFVLERDREILGTIHRVTRAAEEIGGNVFQRWIRRHLVSFDWVLELRSGALDAQSLATFVASTLLLLELDVRAQAA